MKRADINAFLTGEGMNEAKIQGMDDATARSVAKSLGLEFPDVEVGVETYTPTRAKNAKTGQYLAVKAKGSYNSIFIRVCDGETLTSEAAEKVAATLDALVEAALAARSDLDSE